MDRPDDQPEPDNGNDSGQMGRPSIATVAELQPNFIYCDSQAVYDSVNEAQASSKLKLKVPQNCSTKLIPHTLSLRLLHYHGPFERPQRQIVFLASCLHDETRNVLISRQLSPTEDNDVSFDDYINGTFTLQNFMVIPSKICSFNCGEVNCFVGDKPLHSFIIVTSSDLFSAIKFSKESHEYNLEDDDSFESAIEALTTTPGKSGGQPSERKDENESSISDISLSELQPNPLSPQSLMTDDLSRQSTSTASSLKRKHSELIPLTTEINEVAPSGNQVRPMTNRENLDPNAPQHFDSLHAASFSSAANLTLQKEIFGELPDKIKENYNVEPFIRANVHLIDNSIREVTKLSAVLHPNNKVQNYNFANVVGFVTDVIRTDKTQLVICDEETKKFSLFLGFCEVDQVKQNPKPLGTGVFFPPTRTDLIHSYPVPAKGDLVCIRDLCLGANQFRVCLHPTQFLVIEPFRRHELALKNNALSKEEFKRVLELIVHLSDSLVQNPLSYRKFNYDILDFCGQVIAKREIKQGHQNRLQLFLLLPYKTALPTYLNPSCGELITNYIVQSASTQMRKNTYNRQLIDLLIENNRIVMTTLYGIHANLAAPETVGFQLVFLSNVHIKKDQIYSGFQQYIIHDGRDFGRGCHIIEEASIPGNQILRSIDALIKELTVQPDQFSEEEQYVEAMLDEDVIERHNGASVANLLRETHQRHASLYDEPWSAFMKRQTATASLNRERAILKPYINEQIAKPVGDFAQLCNDVLNAEAAALAANQSAITNDQLEDPLEEVYPMYFRVPARMADYVFEDTQGRPIKDMTAFRANLINFYCTNSKCFNMASFYAMAPILSRIIASDVHHQIPCVKCNLGVMAPLFSLQFSIEDDNQTFIAVLLTSPEADEMAGVTSKQLIFTDPLSGDICRAVDFMLKSYCPYRRCRELSEENELDSNKNKQNEQPSHSRSQHQLLNPRFQWIIECVRVKTNDSASQKLFNNHIFESNSSVQRIFYVRGLYESLPS